jgi:prepilin peptidase CpaA
MSNSFELIIYFTPLAFIGFVLLKVVRSDIKQLKILNSDVLILAAGGLFYSVFAPAGAGVAEWQLPGSAGLKRHLISFSAALLIGFFLFALKLWGAGDAKLIAALALWNPYHSLPLLFICIMLVGGVVAIVRIVLKGNAKIVFKNVQSILMLRMAGITSANGFETADRVPFSIAIAGGWVLLVTMKFFGV